MKKMLEQKNILVTGTGRGIGKKMVEIFASYGAGVIAHARTESDKHAHFCEKLAEAYGVCIFPVYFDLSDPDGIRQGVKKIRELKISVDGLVNNAGIGGNSLFHMTRMEELRKIFETNFFGPYLLTQYISKLMVRQGHGSIVSISSTSAQDGNSGKTAYGSAKAALMTMTKCIAEELGGGK